MCALVKKIGESWKRRHLFKPINPIMREAETQTSDISEVPGSSERSEQAYPVSNCTLCIFKSVNLVTYAQSFFSCFNKLWAWPS